MKVLRLIVAGLIAIAAMVTVVLAAVVVFFTGLAGYILQLFRSKSRPAAADHPPGPSRSASLHGDDVIEVVTTSVPADPDPPAPSDRAG